MAHPAWFGGPQKTPQQEKETMATGIKLALGILAVMIVIALVQDYVTDAFGKLVDYTPTKATSEFVIEHDEAE